MSLPRDRFWDIQVSKIDSPTRQPLLPRPSCVRAASPHLRKLGAGYAALPQMTGRDFSYAYFVSPLRYRTPDKQCGPGRYRGLTAFASLSMAVSEGNYSPLPEEAPIGGLWRKCLWQGCQSQTYRDVFTASSGTDHP
ncbi:hypothetical protein [Thiolapillus sp.]|uniref:hypothetical protein n=2 Tax=Thiolapillus sp. TaxID=2017437 RepID=UPI003AF5194D